MKFANDIGGVQEDYPDSKVYGPKYFEPEVVLSGEKEIEKFTWIRGAEKVTIGPRDTRIEWWGWRPLVIPKLRIKAQERIKAFLDIPEVTITKSQPFFAKIMQYADGRHVGGVQVTKRHPNWEPEPDLQKYDLWIRVIDGSSRRAIPETKVVLHTWDEKKEGFVVEAYWYTNEMGIIEVSGLPCSDKKLIVIQQELRQSQIWRFRPLSGQKVKRTFKLWSTKLIQSQYVWRKQDTLKDIAYLTGSKPATILRMNYFHSSTELTPGMVVDIPCGEAILHVEARDTIESLTEYFRYNNIDELAKANELPKPYKLYQDQELRLPGWRFFQARSDEMFEKLDKQFGIPKGWSRPVQRTLHDDPTRAYDGEIVAVPIKEFTQEHALQNPSIRLE